MRMGVRFVKYILIFIASLPSPLTGLLVYMHHPTDWITHTTAFVTPVVEHWLERSLTETNNLTIRSPPLLLGTRAATTPTTTTSLLTLNVDFVKISKRDVAPW